MNLHHFNRRDWLRYAAVGAVGCSLSGWLARLAAEGGNDPKRKRACILLWMNGGPSQTDTFDLKPGHANGGPFKEIGTNVPGIRFSEHFPELAKRTDKLAIIRSMATKEADHGRATYQMHTGRVPGGPIQYPALGAVVAKELEAEAAELPGFVSIAPFRFLSPGAYESGFLGPKYAPLIVGENGGQLVPPPGQQQDPAGALKVQDLDRPAGVKGERSASREKLLDEMEQDFAAGRPGAPAHSHRAAYKAALTMMDAKAVKAFDLSEEPAKLRDRYGRNLFGQGCLLARRLVERGVPFVEVTLSGVPGQQVLGWDTHQNNFETIKKLSGVLDPAWATLMDDLKDHGLLDTTTIVWMGEFGRTPRINSNQGRDHWANAWSTVLAGGGIKGGQVIGKTSADGLQVTERPVSVPDLLATVGQALGLDINKQNQSNVGRPIRLVEPGAKPIKEVLS
ncbi:MAG: DUF1501 domain-containing protein [Gemmataceae bacterium]